MHPNHPNQTAQPEAKRRRALSLGDKLEIIRLTAENPRLKHEDIAIRFGCGRSTITKILGEKGKWLEEEQKGSSLEATKQREAAWVQLEEALMIWINQASSKNLVISDDIIRTKVFE
jgi:hypothetical protein